jgi:membrane protein implicated in regulation of membrane protease activity
MWLLYALALILGGGLLVVQLLGGGHHDGGDHFAGSDHLGGPDHHPAQGPGLLSTRSLTYGLFAFGFVGASLHALRLVAPWAALPIAAAAGVAVTLAVGTTLRAVGDPAASGEAALDEARGHAGRVLVPLSRDRQGKVRVQIKGQTVDLLATTTGGDLPAGTEVVVVNVRGDVAEVIAAPGGLGGAERPPAQGASAGSTPARAKEGKP